MTRLHVDEQRLRSEVVVVSDEDYRYLTRVLRLDTGDSVTLFDGTGNEAQSEIVRLGPRAIELKVTSRTQAAPPEGPRFTLIQALAKGEKFDLVVQKSTELGVHRIMPAATERSVLRLEAERLAGRLGRWQKIAREAARQCGRNDVPEVDAPSTFAVAINSVPRESLKLMLWEGARGGLGRALADLPRRRQHHEEPIATGDQHSDQHSDGKDEAGAGDRRPLEPREVVILVGPEGGFSDDEVARAKQAGFLAVGLGPRILRTETAALAALAVLQFALGQME